VCPCPTHQHTVTSADALVALAATREPQGVRLPAPFQQGMPVPIAPQHRVLCSCARLISSSSQGTTGSALASASSARCARAQRILHPSPMQLRSSRQQRLPGNHNECACQRLFSSVCPCPMYQHTVIPTAALVALAAVAGEPQGVRSQRIFRTVCPCPSHQHTVPSAAELVA
jgi:hypothetical protein